MPAKPSVNDPAVAWARYEPHGDRPWNRKAAAHLLRRAGFGPNRAEIEQAVADGPQQTIDRLLDPKGDVADFEATYADYETASAGSVPSPTTISASPSSRRNSTRPTNSPITPST